LLRKSSGQVRVNNYVLDQSDYEIRKSIGIVFQTNMLDDFLTVRENIVSRGRMYGLVRKQINERIGLLSDHLSADDILDRRYGQLSGGQKRKSDIMRALIHNPKILILDEPTTGLDPFMRQKVWEMMSILRKEQKLTIFLTTHNMEEAAQADYIVIMDKGIIKDKGTPEGLRLKYSYDRLILIYKHSQKLIEYMEEEKIIYHLDRERIVIPLKHALEALAILRDVEAYITSFEVVRGNMDDVFINIIKGDENL